jgi:hypothetical protein
VGARKGSNYLERRGLSLLFLRSCRYKISRLYAILESRAPKQQDFDIHDRQEPADTCQVLHFAFLVRVGRNFADRAPSVTNLLSIYRWWPAPIPPLKLKFVSRRKRVLFDCRGTAPDSQSRLQLDRAPSIKCVTKIPRCEGQSNQRIPISSNQATRPQWRLK